MLKRFLGKRLNVLLSTVTLFILFLLLPSLLSPYHVYLLCEVFVMGLLAYAFYFLLSYGGLMNFGIAAYYGAGTYTVAVLLTKGITESFWLCVLGGIAVATLLAVIIGWFCARRRGIYFALLTLAFSETVHAIIFKWRALTGGDDGIPNVPRPPLQFGFVEVSIQSINHYYYLTLSIFIIALAVIWIIANSNFGYTLRGIRDNPERTSFIGLNVQRQVWIAFIVCGAISGLAGSLHALLAQIANPGDVSWLSGIEPLLAMMIGGISAFTGPFVGALVYIFLKSYLISLWGNWLIVMGFLLIVAVLVFRNGIIGFLSVKFGRPL